MLYLCKETSRKFASHIRYSPPIKVYAYQILLQDFCEFRNYSFLTFLDSRRLQPFFVGLPKLQVLAYCLVSCVFRLSFR